MLLSALHDLTTRRADPRPLAVARIGVGLAALLKAVVMAPIVARLAAPEMLRAIDFAWLPQPGAAVLPLLTALWCAAAVALALGWRSRRAAGSLAVILGYILLLDRQLYSNHLYLLTLLCGLLAIADSGAALSLDARRGQRRTTIPAWPATLMKVQLSIVYLFAALTKVNAYWLAGVLLAVSLRDGELLVVPEALRSLPLVAILAFATVVAELYLALALWSPRQRAGAMALGAAFHLSVILVLPEPLFLAVFSLECLALYALFLDASIWSRLGRAAPVALVRRLAVGTLSRERPHSQATP